MNLFQKYGIKEVADVVFYSVTTVGDEEFYTPVLFLDTLKVSTLEKTAEKVEARGGKGNKKLITWNFGKEVTLNLEDALFSPASMSMIWGGKLNSKLSDYTSAIVKCNIANKYGDLGYSTKAYPSPALTNDEWEVVFNAAHKTGLNSGSGSDYPSIYITENEENENEKAYVQENRENLINKYFKRKFLKSSITRTPIQIEGNEINYLNFFEPFIQDSTPVITHGDTSRSKGLYMLGIYNKEKKLGDDTIRDLPSIETLKDGYAIPETGKDYPKIIKETNGTYTYSGEISIKYKIGAIEKLTKPEDNNNWEEGGAWEIKEQKAIIEIRYKITDDKKIVLYQKQGSPAVRIIGTYATTGYRGKVINLPDNSSTCKDPYNFMTSIYSSEDVIEDESQLTEGLAIPRMIIDNIMLKITSLDKIGYIETNVNDIEVIDRMEKCIVKDKKGLEISTLKQKQNLFRYYADDKTSSYTIYYDAKTMLPLLRIDNGIIDESIDKFTVKIGTVYYKWTRTVRHKDTNEDTILGKTFVIDAETFPDAYKIVGETYIRNQKTGKDQRYQFVIHRANVSTDTSITLEAEGDPTTFSMQIDVLTPPNDIMMELKQYDVEDDPLEGGTRIVPQKSKYTYTPTYIKDDEEVADKNEEIY